MIEFTLCVDDKGLYPIPTVKIYELYMKGTSFLSCTKHRFDALGLDHAYDMIEDAKTVCDYMNLLRTTDNIGMFLHAMNKQTKLINRYVAELEEANRELRQQIVYLQRRVVEEKEAKA